MSQTDFFPADLPPSEEIYMSRKERAAVLARISALIEYWGFTDEELSASIESLGLASIKPAKPVKYRHPVSGETWDGDGPHPEWLRDALLKEGLRVDELRPQNQHVLP